MQNRLIRRVHLNSLNKGDQFKISSMRTLYTYAGKVGNQHTACKWTGKDSGIMTVLSGNLIVELVTGNGMPNQCVFGGTYQKLLLSRKVVVS